MIRMIPVLIGFGCLVCVGCTVIPTDDFEYGVDPNIGEGNVYPDSADTDTQNDTSADTASDSDVDTSTDSVSAIDSGTDSSSDSDSASDSETDTSL